LTMHVQKKQIIMPQHGHYMHDMIIRRILRIISPQFLAWLKLNQILRVLFVIRICGRVFLPISQISVYMYSFPCHHCNLIFLASSTYVYNMLMIYWGPISSLDLIFNKKPSVWALRRNNTDLQGNAAWILNPSAY